MSLATVSYRQIPLEVAVFVYCFMYSWPLCFSQLYTKPDEVDFMPRLTTALTDKELRKKLRDLERVGEPETFSVGGVAGLCVVWKSPANAQWLVRLRVDGKPKNVSLGGLKSMGLKEAREIALYVREHGGQLPVERGRKGIAPCSRCQARQCL